MNLARWGAGNNYPLAERIQRSAFGLTMAIVALVGGVSMVIALYAIPAMERKEHKNDARVIGEVLAGDISNKLGNIRQLSKSSLVSTALTDSTGLDAYLKPFLKAQEKVSDASGFQLFDYRGRTLFGDLSLPADNPQLIEMAAVVVDVLADKRPRFIILDGENVEMFAAFPVLFPYSDEAIGVLAGAIPLGSLFKMRVSSLSKDRAVDLLVNGQSLEHSIAKSVLRYYPVEHDLQLTQAIDGKALALSLYATRNPWLQPLLSLFLLYALVAAFLSLSVWYVAGLIARRTTARLEGLAHVCADLAAKKRVVLPEDPYQDEIGVLSRTLNQAIEAIAVANQALEEKVRLRTLELEAANRQLRTLSTTDGLTGIANRRSFDSAWESEWQRACRHGLPLALVMIDVDQFKAYNDHYGHQAGDVCLQRLAQIFDTAVQRTGELAARYGGEEFVLILPGLNGDEAGALAEKIRARVQALGLPHALGTLLGVVTISLGVASSTPPQHDTGLRALIEAADSALYRAKQKGSNQVQLAGLNG